MLKGLFLFYFCRNCRFPHYIRFFEEIFSVALVLSLPIVLFQNWIFFCTASIGAGIAYDITQLIRFIKCVHQIFHCHTALPQMGLFLVTDLSQNFPITIGDTWTCLTCEAQKSPKISKDLSLILSLEKKLNMEKS